MICRTPHILRDKQFDLRSDVSRLRVLAMLGRSRRVDVDRSCVSAVGPSLKPESSSMPAILGMVWIAGLEFNSETSSSKPLLKRQQTSTHALPLGKLDAGSQSSSQETIISYKNGH